LLFTFTVWNLTTVSSEGTLKEPVWALVYFSGPWDNLFKLWQHFNILSF
jgi:hypothetical protein